MAGGVQLGVDLAGVVVQVVRGGATGRLADALTPVVVAVAGDGFCFFTDGGEPAQRVPDLVHVHARLNIATNQ